MYYQNEIRDINQVPRAESERVTPDELKLAPGLLERMSDGTFERDKYHDYRLRVLAMIDEKFKGHEITAAPKPGPVIDLMEALKQSMKKVPEKKPRAGAKKGVD
jgi:DNA end-binding protein Ku